MAEASKTNRQSVRLTVPVGIEPVRLDQYLALQEELGLSRTRIQKLIEGQEVAVNGQPVATKLKLVGGEVIDLLVPAPPQTDVLGEDIALDVIYEDEYLAVINKPVGMVTHPAAGNYSGTLVNALVHHFKQLPTIRGEERPGIVHRLDKNTSGLMLVARHEDILLKLQQALQRREVKRTYLALVCGHMPKESGKIDLPIGRSTRDRTKMAVLEAGREAVTHYTFRSRFRSYDLLDVNLETGRTHQIRVHFAHMGHPIFGDPEYGGREKWLRGVFAPERLFTRQLLDILDHQALHARKLEFTHPATNQTMVVEAAPPEDFQQILSMLENYGQ